MNKSKIILVSALVVTVLVLFFAIKSIKNKSGGGSVSRFDNQTINKLFDLAKQSQGSGNLLEAKKAYQRILTTATENKIINQVQDGLYQVNMNIIFSPIETEQTTVYEVAPGDSLHGIAKKFNTTIALIKRSNNLAADTIRPGQRLRIWIGKFSCAVDKSQNTLILKSNEEVMRVYQVSTGKQNCTPVGTFTITSKLENPVWFKSGAIVLPNSPDNILGSRWLGFSLAGYGIHGTTDPQSIGQQVTAGCVRMINPQVEELYDILPLGTEVTVVD